MLIVFEGLDGTGKSTLIDRVSELLYCTTTKEPGSPLDPACQMLRKMALEGNISPLARELLFYADAVLHKEALKKEEGLILSDRGKWSHLAYVYALMKTKQISYEDYLLCKQAVHAFCAEPTAFIYLRGSLELMKERLQGKPADKIEANGAPFFEEVLYKYEELVGQSDHVLVLDATSSIVDNMSQAIEYINQMKIKEKQ